jgi:hypothetical protein
LFKHSCKQLIFITFVASLAVWPSPATAAEPIIPGARGGFYFLAYDTLALPGEEVVLRARLKAGDLQTDQPGFVARFHLDGRLYKTAETDLAGTATVSFRPKAAGDYHFTVELSPNGFPDKPPAAIDLLVACRAAEAPMIVVDLDKTVVASGFAAVMAGQPKAMAGAAQIMKRLAERYTIVYLTQRPGVFGPESKAWLHDNGFPPGAMILAETPQLLQGNEPYKREAIRGLTRRFRKIEFGLGDRPSDAHAYAENGLRPILIVMPDASATAEELRRLAGDVESLRADAVRNWDQAGEVILHGKRFPRGPVADELRRLAVEREKSGEGPKSEKKPTTTEPSP